MVIWIYLQKEPARTMKTIKFSLIFVILLVGGICNPDLQGAPFTYHWEIDETPEGSESATVVEPVKVTLLEIGRASCRERV